MYFKNSYDFMILRSEFVLYFSCRVKIMILTTLDDINNSNYNHNYNNNKSSYNSNNNNNNNKNKNHNNISCGSSNNDYNNSI